MASKKFRIKEGDWVLGAWLATSKSMLVFMTIVLRDEGWRGILVTQQQAGKKTRTLQAPVEMDYLWVKAICQEIMDEYLADERCDRMIHVEVLSQDHDLIKRRISLIPWSAEMGGLS